MSQKGLNFVRAAIFYEFLYLASSRRRPRIRENGTSDIISGHYKRRSSGSLVVLCVG